MTTEKHDRPLKPGEVRTHTTRGGMGFRIMHVANGSFTQASGPQGVFSTEMHEHVALRAYAEAIHEAEALEISVDDIVVRRGKEDGPRGEILETATSEPVHGEPRNIVLVSFSGMTPLAMDARNLRRVQDVTPKGMDEMTAEELAQPLWDAVRRHVQGGGSQFLALLIERAEDAAILAEKVKSLADRADARIDEETTYARQAILEDLIKGLRAAIGEKR